MIPPVSVNPRRYRYTLDALLVRSRLLGVAATATVQAASAMVWTSATGVDAERVLLQSQLVHLAGDIARVREDLDGVIATIEPSEWARATMSTGAPWPAVSVVGSWVSSQSPWWETATPYVPVRLTESAPLTAAPQNLAERMARIPDDTDRIRIDRFETPDGPRFEVYLAGTDFTAGPDNPWWVGANLELLGQGESRSLSAMESALRAAGVTATSPLVLTGHSQGGAIALALAASNRFTVDAVFTLGTPAGIVDDVRGVPVVHVIHPEDPVPALGGRVRDHSGTTWILHTEPRVVGTDAHFADTYADTSRRLDRLADPELVELERRLAVPGGGTAMWFGPAN